MTRNVWQVIPKFVFAGFFIMSVLWGGSEAGQDSGITQHHAAAALTITLATQPSPPRAGENLLRVDLTDTQGQPIAHAQVRLVLTQAHLMPGVHSERPLEVEATSTHVGVYVARVHLATSGRWEVIVKVVQPGRPATQAVFSLAVEAS
jgi:hypothetical protein